MSIVRARIEALERRVERLLCLVDKANAQLDGLRDRESRRAVRLWQRRLAQAFGAPRPPTLVVARDAMTTAGAR